MTTSSPGSISRTNAAPTMSSAAVSLATTQPRASRPSTSGRKPCGSRAAYRVRSSMKTSEYAPRTSGSTASALSSTLDIRGSANSAVSTSVSEVARSPSPPCSASAPLAMAASSSVLIRLPLCPRARLATGVDRNVGCAFSHTDAPVVEYRQCPTAIWPRSVDSAASSKTWATRPMSL